jgi:hypothetical protein
MTRTKTARRDSDGNYTSYAWPGAYPVFHLCADGGVLCPTCANDPSNPVHEDPQHNPQWQIVASDINWEDTALTCDHCSNRIESAYGGD